MAVYKAQPGYSVTYGKGEDENTVRFNYFGEYETGVAAEIAALDALVPKWITKEATEPEAAAKPADVASDDDPKTPAKGRKPSGK